MIVNDVTITGTSRNPCVGLGVHSEAGSEHIRLTLEQAEGLAERLLLTVAEARAFSARINQEHAPQMRMACDDQAELAV